VPLDRATAPELPVMASPVAATRAPTPAAAAASVSAAAAAAAARFRRTQARAQAGATEMGGKTRRKT
jgi:hypothetical protein